MHRIKMSKQPMSLHELRNLATESGMVGIHKVETMKLEAKIQDLEARILRLEYTLNEMRSTPSFSNKESQLPPVYGPAIPKAPMRPLF